MLTARLYQETIAGAAVQKNTLVVLPTGLGKTFICVLVAKQRLTQFPDSKILVLAPTKPLVNQHKATFAQFGLEGVVFTGEVKPDIRKELFATNQIIFSTSQGLENDILSSRIKLKEISLLVFDEAHRATGDYSYVWVAKQYLKQATNSRILGLTASPGTDKETIGEVVANLGIEHIEFREHSSPDVAPYVQQTIQRYLEVDLPPSMRIIHENLLKTYNDALLEIKAQGFLKDKKVIYKTELIRFTGALQKQLSQNNFDPAVLKSISLSAQALKVSHAVELIESQGIPSLYLYLEQLFADARAKKTKAVVALCENPHVRFAYQQTKELIDAGVTHPKLSRVLDLVKADIDGGKEKIIVFSQYRDTLEMIAQHLEQISGVRSALFFGQAKKRGKGMSQKKQLETIQEFTDGVFNVLCMSSVGEEGLDIPAVDHVIFYEPISSVIRTIQRKGRTGRQESGRVTMLITRNTRDVAARWSSQRKEKSMYAVLKNFKDEFSVQTKTLDTFTSPSVQKLLLYADSREKSSALLREMYAKDIDIRLQTLEVGDYALSSDVVVEFKEVKDFVDSLVDGRLLTQIKSLKESVLKPLIVVQGEESIFSQRNVHPNSLYGMLSTIMLSYGIPVLFTRNAVETANLFIMIMRREQQGGVTSFSLHAKKPLSHKEQLEYVVSAFPSIGHATAQSLLTHFGSIYNLLQASQEQLQQVEGIGQKTATHFFHIVHAPYNQ